MSNVLPPIIEDWITKIKDPSTPEHIKENYCLMLEQVAIASAKAVEAHRTKKNVALARKKRKVALT